MMTGKEIKKTARAQLIGRYSSTIPAVLLVSVVQFIVFMVTDSGASSMTPGGYLIKYAISLIVDLLTGILLYGRCFFFLKIARGQMDASPLNVFHGFKNNMDKAVLLQVPFTCVSFLCTLPSVLINLGVIPFPEADYRLMAIVLLSVQILLLFITRLYLGLAFYILCDRPELSVTEIFAESVRLMTNKKGKLITICLGMIPLMILAALGLMIGLLWYESYFRTVHADFYLDALGEEPALPIKAPRQDPDDYTTSDTHL